MENVSITLQDSVLKSVISNNLFTLPALLQKEGDDKVEVERNVWYFIDKVYCTFFKYYFQY